MQKKFKLHWLFNRSILVFLLSLIGLIGVAIIINVMGIHLTGTIDNWRNYLMENASYFLIWRVFLYALVIVGWLWAKKRLMALELTEQPQGIKQLSARLTRIEIASVVAFLVLEISNWEGR